MFFTVYIYIHRATDSMQVKTLYMSLVTYIHGWNYQFHHNIHSVLTFVCVSLQGMMGVVGWMLLLLSQMMLPVASQKPPGLSVGVIMGQTRPVSDQEVQPPRRPDDALDISVVTLRINQTDPKSVITQVRKENKKTANYFLLYLTHTQSFARVLSLFPRVPRCVSSCLALVSTALCLLTAPIRRPLPRSLTSSPFRHSFQSWESTEAPLWLWLTRWEAIIDQFKHKHTQKTDSLLLLCVHSVCCWGNEIMEL